VGAVHTTVRTGRAPGRGRGAQRRPDGLTQVTTPRRRR
jgi:hypothetical protein